MWNNIWKIIIIVILIIVVPISCVFINKNLKEQTKEQPSKEVVIEKVYKTVELPSVVVQNMDDMKKSLEEYSSVEIIDAKDGLKFKIEESEYKNLLQNELNALQENIYFIDTYLFEAKIVKKIESTKMYDTLEFQVDEGYTGIDNLMLNDYLMVMMRYQLIKGLEDVKVTVKVHDKDLVQNIETMEEEYKTVYEKVYTLGDL